MGEGLIRVEENARRMVYVNLLCLFMLEFMCEDLINAYKVFD